MIALKYKKSNNKNKWLFNNFTNQSNKYLKKVQLLHKYH